jgi:hypothetical protein
MIPPSVPPRVDSTVDTVAPPVLENAMIEDLLKLGVLQKHIDKCGGDKEELSRLLARAKKAKNKKHTESGTSTQEGRPADVDKARLQQLVEELQQLGVKSAHIEKCGDDLQKLEALVATARERLTQKGVKPPPRNVSDAETDWSDQDDKILKAALKKHPASLPTKERFTLIAEDVPSRSAKECYARFKELKKAHEERSLRVTM